MHSLLGTNAQRGTRRGEGGKARAANPRLADPSRPCHSVRREGLLGSQRRAGAWDAAAAAAAAFPFRGNRWREDGPTRSPLAVVACPAVRLLVPLGAPPRGRGRQEEARTHRDTQGDYRAAGTSPQDQAQQPLTSPGQSCRAGWRRTVPGAVCVVQVSSAIAAESTFKGCDPRTPTSPRPAPQKGWLAGRSLTTRAATGSYPPPRLSTRWEPVRIPLVAAVKGTRALPPTPTRVYSTDSFRENFDQSCFWRMLCSVTLPPRAIASSHLIKVIY